MPPLNRPIYVISLSSKEEELSEENKLAFEISTFLKKLGIHSSILFSGSIKKQISNANKQNSCGIIILGEDELQKKEITLKNLDTSEQTSISFQNFFQMNKEEVLNLFKTK